MKFIVFMTVTLLSSNLFAGVSYICRQSDGQRNRTIILSQLGDDQLDDGLAHPFHIKIILDSPGGGLPTMELETTGSAISEHSQLVFTSKNSLTKFSIFIDEPDTSYLEQIGQNMKDFFCKLQ